jgi:hypothetical protein
MDSGSTARCDGQAKDGPQAVAAAAAAIPSHKILLAVRQHIVNLSVQRNAGAEDPNGQGRSLLVEEGRR